MRFDSPGAAMRRGFLLDLDTFNAPFNFSRGFRRLTT